MQITNGSITFERTRKTADYEGKKASVTLSFTIADGEDYEGVCSSVGAAATLRALIMVGETAAPGATEAPRARAPRAVPPSAQPGTVQSSPPDGTRAPGAALPSASGPTATSAASHSEAPSDPFGAPAPSAPASAPASAIVSNSPSPTPAAEITDGMLQDAIKAKVAADAKHTPGVMELIQTFTGNPLAKIYSVADQAKRAEFLAKLAAL